MTGTILVRGGGHPDPAPFFTHLVGLAGRPQPRVLYVPTAAGNPDASVRLVYDQVIAAGGMPRTLNFFAPVPVDLDAALGEADIVYVGGGNTRSMLAVWREWGFDTALRRAFEGGAVLSGGSAGGLCWFEAGTTDSWAGPLRAIEGCLGLLPGSHCPHYDGEAQRRPTYRRMVADGTLAAGYALDDAAVMQFRGNVLETVWTLKPGSTAYRVEASEDGSRETALEALPFPG